MNENNKVVDFTKLKVMRSKVVDNDRLNLKRYASSALFLNTSSKTKSSTINHQNSRSSKILKHTKTSSSFQIDAIKTLSTEAESTLPNTPYDNASLLIEHSVLKSRNLDLKSNFLWNQSQFYCKMLEYFDHIIYKSIKKSSFRMIADWFEFSKNERFYDVDSDNVYADPVENCIIKEYFMLELIIIDLHLLLLNKLHDFSETMLKEFYSIMKVLFGKFQSNFNFIYRIGPSSKGFQGLLISETKSIEKFAFVISNNKDIKFLIKKLVGLIKENVLFSKRENFGYKRLKMLSKCYYDESYFNLKVYSYNVYLFNGIFFDPLFKPEGSLYNLSSVERANEKLQGSVFGEKFKPNAPFLSQQNRIYKYTLVLDLDETLIHCIKVSFLINFKGHDISYVVTRPYLDYFLRKLSKSFEIVVFTAANSEYADAILNEFDKKKYIAYRLYRQHLTKHNGISIKDLELIGRDLNRTVIIDDIQENFSKQPENGVRMPSFHGGAQDKKLLDLAQFLLKVISVSPENIKPYLPQLRSMLLSDQERKPSSKITCKIQLNETQNLHI